MTAQMPLSKLLRCLEEFRKLDPELPMQRATTFVLVAMHEGCTMRQLAEWTGVVHSTANRNVQALGEYASDARGKSGFGLLRTAPDPHDTRRKVVYLTNKGKRICASLISTLDELGTS